MNLSVETRIAIAEMVLSDFPALVEDKIRRQVYKHAITCDVPKGTLTNELKCLSAEESLYTSLKRYVKGLVNNNYGKAAVPDNYNVMKITLPVSGRTAMIITEKAM